MNGENLEVNQTCIDATSSLTVSEDIKSNAIAEFVKYAKYEVTGRQLKKIRAELNVSQTELAALLRVSFAKVKKLELKVNEDKCIPAETSLLVNLLLTAGIDMYVSLMARNSPLSSDLRCKDLGLI